MNIFISNRSDTPIYQQIVDAIRQDILNGTLAEGDALPSIRMLARDLSVSVITTKKAYELLEAQGYIQTQPQKGSVVSRKSAQLALEHKQSAMEQHILDAIDLSKELHLQQHDFLKLVSELYKEA